MLYENLKSIENGTSRHGPGFMPHISPDEDCWFEPVPLAKEVPTKQTDPRSVDVEPIMYLASDHQVLGRIDSYSLTSARTFNNVCTAGRPGHQLLVPQPVQPVTHQVQVIMENPGFYIPEDDARYWVVDLDCRESFSLRGLGYWGHKHGKLTLEFPSVELTPHADDLWYLALAGRYHRRLQQALEPAEPSIDNQGNQLSPVLDSHLQVEEIQSRWHRALGLGAHSQETPAERERLPGRWSY